MQVKVCGMKYRDNIIEVNALKPDFMGFIFYSGSKRFVGEHFEMPNISPDIKKVGVFVDADATYIIDKVNLYKLDMIQLHGNEKPEFCEVLNHLVPVIKGFGVDETFEFNKVEPYANCCDYFLFDTKTSEHGGSGKQFDWTLLEQYDNKVPFFISGGIGLEDVGKLKISKLKAFAIDVNSKFETEPGMKNVVKLKEFQDEL